MNLLTYHYKTVTILLGIVLTLMLGSCIAQADLIVKKPDNEWVIDIPNYLVIEEEELDIYWQYYDLWLNENEFCTFEDYMYNHHEQQIPEPLTISLIAVSGLGLILTRKLYAYRRNS
tara:strand:- start:2621 stop:2971 length:351 start_codon:yes stop_codon:yes gene_type:complete